MTALSVDSSVALGFVLGLRHAIEADHLAAISTIVTERRSLLSSLLVGASWGLGHTLALLLAGAGVLLLRYQMTDRMAHALELCVGVMLVLLGANVLRTLSAPRGDPWSPSRDRRLAFAL
jgi:high-affinity nickel permease